MILYAVTLSPFAARVRLALRVKGIGHDLLPPPGGGTRSPEFLAINPIGKLPVLVTDDGLTIVESETIIDHLDEQFPTPALTPVDPRDRARMRTIIRAFELYATPAMFRLFKQIDLATRDPAVVEAEVARWREGLALTSGFVDNAMFAVGGAISKADCILLPSLLLCGVTASIFGLEDPLADLGALAGYRDKARTHEDMGVIWTETADALAAMRAQP
ncbi:glutathione S-transferase [Sphingomonas zeicaulis]|uniref:glutathione S-transferase family protein n=1 Tax=Sphingomonas zeicaulis TaxID=1632740 RepID=UPI003D21A835